MTSVSPVVLDEGHQLVNQFSQLCGNLNPDGWTVRWGTVTATLTDLVIKSSKLPVFLRPSCPCVCRCSQLELRGCTLREVCLNIQRDGEPQDTPFSCRVGEIMVRQLCSMFCLYCTLLEARQKLVHLWTTTQKSFSCSDSHNVLGSYTVYSNYCHFSQHFSRRRLLVYSLALLIWHSSSDYHNNKQQQQKALQLY